MSVRVALLPGWGFGEAVLQPLAAALRPSFEVQVQPLPVWPPADSSAWLDDLEQRVPRDAWLVGWSLGGMLAALLAARRQAGCPGLVTLASNLRFVASPDWPTGMPVATFAAFADAYAQHPGATLKRFAMLCSQGASDPRGLSRQLLAAAVGHDGLGGLQLLATLDTRAALLAYGGPQLHLFAGNDALVPAEAAPPLQRLLPTARVCCSPQASHAWVLEQAGTLAQQLRRFMETPR